MQALHVSTGFYPKDHSLVLEKLGELTYLVIATLIGLSTGDGLFAQHLLFLGFSFGLFVGKHFPVSHGVRRCQLLQPFLLLERTHHLLFLLFLLS